MEAIWMEFDFVFENDLQKMIDERTIFYDEELGDVKGLSVPALEKIFINLTASQWSDVDEITFINELTKTITHEISHIEIGDIDEEFTRDGEETVCQMFAGQLFWLPIEIENFK